MRSLIVVDEAYGIVRDHLHDAVCLLLEREDLRLLLSQVFVLNGLDCLCHIFEVGSLAALNIALYGSFYHFTNLPIVNQLLIHEDIVDKSATEKDSLRESQGNWIDLHEKEEDVVLLSLRVLAKDKHYVDHDEAAELEVFIISAHLLLNQVIKDRDLMDREPGKRMNQRPNLRKTQGYQV